MVTHSNAFFGFSYPIHFLLGRCTLLLISKCGSMAGILFFFLRLSCYHLMLNMRSNTFSNETVALTIGDWIRCFGVEIFDMRYDSGDFPPKMDWWLLSQGAECEGRGGLIFVFELFVIAYCVFSSSGCRLNFSILKHSSLRVHWLLVAQQTWITVLKKFLLFDNFSYCFRRAFRAVEFHAIGVCTYFLWYFKAVL